MIARYWRKCDIPWKAPYRLFTERSKTSSQHHTWRGPSLAALGVATGAVGATFCYAERDSELGSRTALSPRSSCKYLICGGGVAAQEALKVFIDENAAGEVLLVSPEWRDIPVKVEGIIAETDDQGLMGKILGGISYILSFTMVTGRKGSPDIVIGPRVKALDSANRIALLDDGTEVSFERCLIAVGSTIPDIPVGKVVSRDASNLVSGAQSNSDWRHMNEVVRENYIPSPISAEEDMRAHVTIVGGGWMSPIVAADLIDRGADITFSHAEPSFLARYFPKYVAQDVLSRLLWQSDGGIDSLSYSAVRYVVAREPLKKTHNPVEAEVHVGTVFDSFSIVDFRTDHVVFAPTLASKLPIDAPNLTVNTGGFVANGELAVASDIYVAGSAASMDSRTLGHADGMRWSADHARATGRHAALNMLGAREAYSHKPTLTVDLSRVNLRIEVVGDVDGSCETFGYFSRSRHRTENTCGGQLEIGCVFYVTPAPLKHRGALQRLQINGVAIWEGSKSKRVENLFAAKEAASELLKREGMTRPELEGAMDNFATEYLGISLYQEDGYVASSNTTANRKLDNDMNDAKSEPSSFDTETADMAISDRESGTDHTDACSSEQNDKDASPAFLKPLSDMRKPSPLVVWRRHRAARSVPIRKEELLWVEDEWVGASSPNSRGDKMAQAYSDLIRRSSGKN